jgi:hypothetical protein
VAGIRRPEGSERILEFAETRIEETPLTIEGVIVDGVEPTDPELDRSRSGVASSGDRAGAVGRTDARLLVDAAAETLSLMRTLED